MPRCDTFFLIFCVQHLHYGMGEPCPPRHRPLWWKAKKKKQKKKGERGEGPRPIRPPPPGSATVNAQTFFILRQVFWRMNEEASQLRTLSLAFSLTFQGFQQTKFSSPSSSNFHLDTRHPNRSWQLTNRSSLMSAWMTPRHPAGLPSGTARQKQYCFLYTFPIFFSTPCFWSATFLKYYRLLSLITRVTSVSLYSFFDIPRNYHSRLQLLGHAISNWCQFKLDFILWYFVGTNVMLVGFHVPTNFQMYRQNSENALLEGGRGGGANCPPPPPPGYASGLKLRKIFFSPINPILTRVVIFPSLFYIPSYALLEIRTSRSHLHVKARFAILSGSRGVDPFFWLGGGGARVLLVFA